jgi:putative copper resistance protein D
VDLGLVVARFVHFVATMGLFGACVFSAALAPAALRPALQPHLRRFGPPLALLAWLSALCWFVLVARNMAGTLDFEGLANVLFGTSFGLVWLGRLALLTALLVSRGIARLALAGAAVASLALVGHAAMQDGGLGVAHRANHALHLLAVACWLGGLPLFLVALRLFREAPQRRDALVAMRNFSRIGHFVVATILVSGALDVAMTSQALPWPPTTPYRQGLALKVGVFLAMTGLALVNRYVFAPWAGRRPAAGRALAAGAVVEIALALVALALVSAFATQDPS